MARTGNSGLPSIPLKYRLCFGDEGAIRPTVIPGLHADRLRLRLRLDGGIDVERPFPVQASLGHGVAECRAVGELLGQTSGPPSGTSSGATTRLKKPHLSASSLVMARPV